MLRNYFKIALRSLAKNKTYTFINIVGLSLGLASAFLIFALVRYHFGIDQHHRQADRIYRITTQFNTPDGISNTTGVPYPFGKAVRNDYPQIEQVTMIEEQYTPMVLVEDKGGSKKFKSSNSNDRGAFVEPNFFKLFDYQWIIGNATDLIKPNTVVLSQQYAERYFGTTQCLGKMLKLEGRLPLKVIGVFANYQDNTDFAFQIMPSYASLRAYYGGGELDSNFGNTNSSSQCFVLLNEQFSKADWEKQMLRFVKKHKPDGVKDTRFVMTSLRDNHFSPDFGNVSQNLILSLLLIGVFLIITASINFVNLATAQALKRSKEVGVRKVLGSTKSQLFWQFIFETTLITLFATGISILLFKAAQPLIQSQLTGIFKFTFYFTPNLLLYLAGIIVLVVLCSGAYPGLVLGGFRPVMALKGKISTQQLGGFSVRRGLVVMQFAISQVLIIGMLVVGSQLSYFNNKDLGFKKEALLTVQLPFTDEQDVAKLSTYRNLVQGLAGIEGFSYSMSGPPQSGWTSSTSMRFDNRPNSEDFSPHVKYIDAQYMGLYGIKLVAGRNLMASDTAREALVNEAMVKKLGLKKPENILNKIIHSNGRKLPVVGVVQDFHMSALNQSIAPLYMTTRSKDYYFANVKLRSGNFQQTIKSIGKAYDQVYPDNYFDPQFVDEQIAQNYQNELTMSRLVNFFALIAILIGCLGLYGLVSFMAAQKTKEIGIRKVLGASEVQILGLFGREFGRLIVLAFVIAAPLAWWAMDKWLQNYEYRISIGWGVFGLAISTTAGIALFTVGYQALRAALTNPVKSLKTD